MKAQILQMMGYQDIKGNILFPNDKNIFTSQTRNQAQTGPISLTAFTKHFLQKM